MPSHGSDEELYALLKRELFTAVVGDVLDQLGFRRQFLPFGIAPLRPEMKLAGRAMPVLGAEVSDAGGTLSPEEAAEAPFGLMLRALDDLKPGETRVVNVYMPTNWASRHKGATAAGDGVRHDELIDDTVGTKVF